MKIARSCPTGGGKNQHNNTAERLKRMLIKKSGGNSPNPAFAKVNPTPQLMGTESAKPMSLGVMRILILQLWQIVKLVSIIDLKMRNML
jgi:hypothetical protein